MAKRPVLQFKITLQEVEPTIWRRIQNNHKHLLEWVGGQFDPERFDPGKVKFDNPRKRWERAFT